MKRGLFFTTILVLLLGALPSAAQSTSQDFPTPVTSNEIVGTIKARDIGDPRQTTYFYTFNGDQGDVFINIVTRNFTGDVDVFAVPGLRSVTKIVIFANDTDNETGRAVYFRKSEKLLLRIQGRSPNDDPASFRIKFAGSFVTAKESDVLPEPELPKINTSSKSGVRVNSVGTIIPAPPKVVLVKTEPVEAADVIDKAKSEDQKAEDVAAGDPPKTDTEKPAKGLEVVVTDNLPKKDETAAARTPPRRTPVSRRRPPAKTGTRKPQPVEVAAEAKSVEMPPEKPSAEAKDNETPPIKKASRNRAVKKPKVLKEPVADPLASIRLVIAFKDGKVIEKTMSEVVKFSVDKGILTVILKDGTISRYQIIDVSKVTIE